MIRRWTILICFLSLAFSGVIFLAKSKTPLQVFYPSILSDPLNFVPHCDFYPYWKSAKVLFNGENPYEPAALEKVNELNVPASSAGPLMMWNPPWVPLLFVPYTFLPFLTALGVWSLINVIIIISIGFVYAHRKSVSSVCFFVLACLTCMPILQAIIFAQMGIVLALGVVLTLIGLERKLPLLFLLGIVLLMIKFHLFLLFFPAIFANAIRVFDKSTLTKGCLAILAYMLLPSIFRGSVFTDWISVLTKVKGQGFAPTGEWQTSSWLTFLKGNFPALSSIAPSFIGVVLVIVALIMFIYLVYRKKILSTDELSDVLVVSCLVCPYLWVFDFSILLPLQLELLRRYLRGEKAAQIPILQTIALQAIMIVTTLSIFHSMEQYFWYSWVFALIWLSYRRSEGYKEMLISRTIS